MTLVTLKDLHNPINHTASDMASGRSEHRNKIDYPAAAKPSGVGKEHCTILRLLVIMPAQRIFKKIY